MRASSSLLVPLLGAAVAVIAGACGSESSPQDGAIVDGAIVDGAVVDGAVVDGAVADAGGVDGDGDGVVAARDCDDSDPSVGSEATLGCTGTCAAGRQYCRDGAWGACDAPADCACENARSDAHGPVRPLRPGLAALRRRRLLGGPERVLRRARLLRRGDRA